MNAPIYRSLSGNFNCPRCNASLPPLAIFCSSCGKRVKKEKKGGWGTRTENGDDDAQTQLEVPLQSELLQSLPATPAPSVPGAWQQVPETEVPAFLSEKLTAPSTPVPDVVTKKHPFSQHMTQRVTRLLTAVSTVLQQKVASNPSRSDWLWSTIIIISAVAAGLVNFEFTDTAIRPIIVFWFLFACPGMVLVRFLHLKEPVAEWTLAIALSFAIDAIVAGAQLYAGRWSVAGTLILLMGFSLCGAIVQLAPKTISVPKLLNTVRSRKSGVLLPVLLTILVGVIVGASIWTYEVYHSPGSAPSTSALPHKATSYSSPTSTVVPTPSSTSSVNIGGLYYGTIYDIPANVTTEMSLTRIQQTQISINGNFTGLQRTGTFSGTIDPSKHIQFTVKDSAGHVILSFNGDMQSGGELSGNYCGVDQNVQCTGEYGLWSVASAS